MNQLVKRLAVFSIAFGLVACNGAKDAELEIESPAPSRQQPSSASTQVGTVGGSNVSGSETSPDEIRRNDMGVAIDEFGVPTQTVFYFNFNQASLNADDLDALASHGQYIASTDSAVIRLEGHTDERGTREYNIALGENRAKAVERILQLQGVKASQISILSLGEEQPADPGHSDSSWEQNRRVELIYESK
jgi:peptidoglycan-associated lipoprotein